ncbi:hypothetical protein J1614_004200 [Plenodomus biglobosus]|nr:hypothetical protein J1614_004200 [Plenodomus biglobosus]
MLPVSPQNHLIDVRTPAEFSTGHLTSDIAPTLNIEYQSIAQLESVYAARGINVQRDDYITLYCRSGRRSGLAMKTLKDMGFERVRDIGGLEEARRVLDRETVERQLEAMVGSEEGISKKEESLGGEAEDEGGKEYARVKGFGKLVEGLRQLEG